MIDDIRANMPELPAEKRQYFKEKLDLTDYDAQQLTAQRATTDYFEATLAALGGKEPKLIANWILTDLAAVLNRAEQSIDESPIRPEQLAGLIRRRSEERRVGKGV